MTRIVAGAARGRRLVTLPGRLTRPTADRAREGLFSTLESLVGPLAGVRFADLYAGSGAVGLEALSRGAGQVLLVESDARAARVVGENIALVGLAGADALHAPVERAAAGPPPGGPFDDVFLDPPYRLATTALRAVVADLLAHGWLASGAVLAVERAARDSESPWPPEPPEPSLDPGQTRVAQVTALRTRRYGEAILWYGRAGG